MGNRIIIKNTGFILTAIAMIVITSFNSLYSQDYFKKSYNYNFHNNSVYRKPIDTLVLQKLAWWQGLKFGFMITWGHYSGRGITESWTLNSEDLGWNQRWGPRADTIEKFREWYESGQSIFNPVNFNPSLLATYAKNAGMKYLVFTTKHHDGFCMFNTTTTDYCITNPKSPFSQDPRANITEQIFTAFRNEGFGIGIYFSKPDWHSNYYWWKYFAAPDRNVNYDILKYPDRWNNFKNYTYSQIQELGTNYGNIDILWMDGGWVTPGYLHQDINTAVIANMMRAYHPGMLIVDRGGPPEYEDYKTPEKVIPDEPPPYPWETCMPIGICWAWVQGETYKPTNLLIHMLVEVVAKGGNLLLNTGINPMGELDTGAYNRLNEIGQWMNVNSAAIYNTTPLPPYKIDRYCFTKKPDSTFVIYIAKNNETKMPPVVTWRTVLPGVNSSIFLIGYNQPLEWNFSGNGEVNVFIPVDLQNNPPCLHAWTFVITNPLPVVKEEKLYIPLNYKLQQNYPNPFNPVTDINFEIPKKGNVSIKIYDVSGRLITTLINNELKEAGVYKLSFNGTEYSSGVYFLKMEAGNFTSSIKMTLLK